MDDDLLKPTLHIVSDSMSSEDNKWAMSMEIKLAKLVQEVSAVEQKQVMIETLLGSRLDEVKRIVSSHMDEEERTIARIHEAMRDFKKEMREMRDDFDEKIEKAIKELKDHMEGGYVSQVNFERLAARISEDNAANQKAMLDFFDQRQEKSLKKMQTIIGIAVGVMTLVSIVLVLGGAE